MQKTKLHELSALGQSIWLDYISRPLIETGKLQGLIDKGLRGMTSNPTIFNQAISHSKDYDEKIIQLHEKGRSDFEIYDDLTILDVQDAADIFRPVYEQTQGLDGFVSLEINPKLARKTSESIEEGKRLFAKVNRPNVMIKVPSTEAGFPVIEELLASGIPVNVTLIFSFDQYLKTAAAYKKGIDRLIFKGAPQVQSVASVFVSRIDAAIDKMLQERITVSQDTKARAQLESLKGKAAVANCKVIFEEFNNRCSCNPTQIQRVLWASTGTKNPDYSDIKYVTELMSSPTVNTLPEKTLDAVLDHGIAALGLKGTLQEADDLLNQLNQHFGINVNSVCDTLLEEGVAAFEKSFDELLTAIQNKVRQLLTSA